MPRQPIKQERAHETRARIIAGSASAFAESGYSGTTIADILKCSNVTKGALYFHFDTKEDVAQAVLESHSAWLSAAAGSVRGQGLQGLVDLTYLFCDAFVSDDVLRAAARLSVDRETFGLAQVPAFLQWETLFAAVLTEAEDHQVLAPAVDVESVARVAMTMMLGAHLASLVADDGRSGIHEEMQKFWRITLPGIAAADALSGIDFAFNRQELAAAASGLVPAST